VQCLLCRITSVGWAMATIVPKLFSVTQTFPRPRSMDNEEAVRSALATLHLERKTSAGHKIGITVGSRGIQNLVSILRTTVAFIRELGCEPYLLAAMGSHGGGTEQGQKEILDSLGLTEAALGAEVLTCAESRIITTTPEGLPVFMIESALRMDGILLVNRVKTHTSFKGVVESGLAKKLVVGLGGPKGAQQFHRFGPEELPRLLVVMAKALLAKLPVLGGLGIVENAYEETALIRAVVADGLIEQESELLHYSKQLMPALPVDDIDLLIVQEIGKNFSGTGMDTNIIGRARIAGLPEPATPRIRRIAVLALSEESHGNATGLGLADFTTRALVDRMDRQATYLNCLTSTFVVRAAIPMYFDTEEKLIDAALYSLAGIPPDKLRIVIIPNTLHLTQCLVSEALAAELAGRSGVSVALKPQHVTFDSAGMLLPKLVVH